MTECNKKTPTLLKDKLNLIILKLKSIANINTDKELADIFGVESSLLTSWKRQRKEIPIQYLVDFCDKYKVSLDYLLRSEGIIDIDTNKNEDTILIHYYDSASDIFSFSYVTVPLWMIKGDPKNIKAIRSETNEMKTTAPVDSVIFIDTQSIKVAITPKTFLFTNRKDYFLRRVSINTKGEYYVSCENKHISDTTINPKTLEIVGELKGVLRWGIPNC